MLILHPDETLLEGRWCADGGKIEADSTALRIGHLVRDHLDRLAASADGWSILYRDRIDGRLWELTYPQSEMHGGGPPRLETIDPKVARLRFDFPAESTSRENRVGEQDETQQPPLAAQSSTSPVSCTSIPVSTLAPASGGACSLTLGQNE